MGEVWYRYKDYLTGSIDDWDDSFNPSSTRINIRAFEYRVDKVTRCGVRLETGRFVNRSSRKRWACPTKEEALVSFIARKRRQLRILRSQVINVEEALAIAEKLK